MQITILSQGPSWEVHQKSSAKISANILNYLTPLNFEMGSHLGSCQKLQSFHKLHLSKFLFFFSSKSIWHHNRIRRGDKGFNLGYMYSITLKVGNKNLSIFSLCITL